MTGGLSARAHWLRRPQFRLRSLFIVTTVASLALGAWAYRRHMFQMRVAAVRTLNFHTIGEGNLSTKKLLRGYTDIFHSFPVGAGDLTPDDVVVSVGVSYLPVSDEMVAAMAHLPTLRSFSFIGSAVTDARLMSIFNHPSIIEELDFSNTPIGDELGPHLGRMPKLVRLNLSETAVSGAVLAHLQGLRELTRLHLSGDQISDESLRHLRALPKLYMLSLTQTPISDAALRHIGEISSLRLLFLDNCAISGAGLAHLAGLVNLTYLDLSRTCVSDCGLANLRALPSLCQLYLHYCDITEAGLRQLIGMKSLTNIHLWEAPLDEAAAQRLERLDPKLDIDWGID